MTGSPDEVPLEERPAWTLTVEEIRELNQRTQWADASPLSDHELQALRRRLNEPDNEGRMSARERSSRHRLGAIIRPREAVDELLDEVTAAWSDIRYSPSTQRFRAGVEAGLRWATGRAQPSPLKGVSGSRPPSYREVYAERSQATRISEGEAAPGADRDYATGVEHSLMWLMGETAERPWGRKR